jgi:hypothetical protein
MEASVTENYTLVRECGWAVVYESLRDWWARRFPLPDLKPYADLLGNEDPEKVMEALRSLQGDEWRPQPSGLYRAYQELNAERLRGVRDRSRQTLRPDQLPAALRRVRQLLRRGDHECVCIPRPANWLIEELNGRIWSVYDLQTWEESNRRSKMAGDEKTPLPPHILRCVECRGIERGQVMDAEDSLDF